MDACLTWNYLLCETNLVQCLEHDLDMDKHYNTVIIIIIIKKINNVLEKSNSSILFVAGGLL